MPELSSLVVAGEHAQAEEEKYLTLSTEFRFGEEKTEMMIEEKLRKPKDGKVQPAANIPPPQSETDDDWFVLLDVSPRQASYIPPGILNSNLNLGCCLLILKTFTVILLSCSGRPG